MNKLGQFCAHFMALCAVTIGSAAASAQESTLVQWGSNGEGQTTNAPAPEGPYLTASAGWRHSVALRGDGSLVQWGATSGGQTVNAPPSAGPYKAVAAGWNHSLALRSDGSLVQWGLTTNGQGTNAPPAEGPYIAIAAGAYHSLALRADGSLVQWGATGSSQAVGAPAAEGPYIAIAAGAYHNLALTANGALVQWGSVAGGQNTNLPPLSGPYIAISAGLNHSLAVRADGVLLQWGASGSGQTGGAPAGIGPFVAVAAGWFHSVALYTDGSIVQWGPTSSGQQDRMPGLAVTYRAIFAGGDQNLAITGLPDQPTRFEFQGQLSGPVGDVDLRLRVYNSESGGSPVGWLNEVRSVARSPEGVFTATVDPGRVDLRRPMWLEISAASAGSGAFATLQPRQPVLAAPIVGFARSAGRVKTAYSARSATVADAAPWAGVSGVPAAVLSAPTRWRLGGASLTYTEGNVGFGIGAPLFGLHVVAPVGGLPTAFLESDATAGTWLNLRNSGTGGAHWRVISTGSSRVEGAGKMVLGWGSIPDSQTTLMTLQQNGNVGIGVAAPTQRLQVLTRVLANEFQTPSSARFKHNVVPMVGALGNVLELEGVWFDWDAGPASGLVGRDFGFVAEDVATVFPQVVLRESDGTVLGIDYARLTAVAVEAIKEGHARVERDRTTLIMLREQLARRREERAALRSELDELRARVMWLEKRMNPEIDQLDQSLRGTDR